MVKNLMALAAVVLLMFTAAANGQESLSANLSAFKPFIGKTWKGEFKSSTPEKPVFDVARWERVLNGQAIRALHSVNNGEYGGESLMVWDAQKKSIVYYYFTTAGFYTSGTMTVENGKYVSHEYVTGNTDGITEVKGVGEILPDGRLRATSEYLQNGKWVQGHEITYVEDAAAQVIFK